MIRTLVPSYRPDGEQLRRLVESLETAGAHPVVLANGAPAVVSARGAGLSFLDPGTNAGFGPSINWAAEQLEDWDWLLLANDDLLIEADLLAAALERAVHARGAVIVHLDDEAERSIPGITAVLTNVSLVARLLERAGVTTRSAEGVYRSFSCVLISRTAWNGAGGFDARMPFTYEDADFVRRLRRSGGRVEHEPDAGVHHERSKSSSRAVRFVLPVSTWSALVYLKIWTRVPEVVLRSMLVLALLVRLGLAPLGRAPWRAHVAGIRAAISSLVSDRAPSMPPFDPAAPGRTHPSQGV